MRRLRWPRSLTIWPLLAVVMACSGTTGPQSGGRAGSADQRQVPFRDVVASASASPSPVSATSVQDNSLQASAGLPFHDPQNLPAGTLLTVRLMKPVSADGLGTETFEAVVDRPVIIEGATIVPLGANVAGRVESARASAVERNRGYIRLTLDAIALQGRDMPIQTTSLFASANAEVDGGSTGATPAVRLEKGRRLTFRLTEPAYVVNERPLPTH